MTPAQPQFAALLTPQGKIIVDCIVAEAPAEDGGGFFLDCPRALAGALVEKLNFYKLRAKVICEDLSEMLGVLAVWDGTGATEYGLVYPDPRLPALGLRVMLPPHLAEGGGGRSRRRRWSMRRDYEAHRIALGVPRGGLDFIYGDAFPHETDMDQLAGVDFDKGCYVGQEVVSRMEHRGTARTRIVPVAVDGFAPEAGVPVMAGDKPVGTTGSARRQPRRSRMLRLDRVADALAAGLPLIAGGVAVEPRKPDWAHVRLAGREGGRMSAPILHPDGLHRCPWPARTTALRRLSRRRMGRAGIRRPRALREARARRLPGRPVLDHHPAQARQLPPRLRRLRAGEDRALRRAQEGQADAGRRHRAQPAQDRGRGALGARLSRRDGEGPGLLGAAVGFPRRQAEGQPLSQTPSRCRPRPRCRSEMSKELAARGFKFVGPTIVYAFMQAVGMVNDHLVTCHRHEAVQKLGKRK